MEVFKPETFIKNSVELIHLFGYWPTFHDAEVVEISLSRGNLRPNEGAYEFPTLTAKIHAWELTDEKGNDGFLKKKKHTAVILKFWNVENISISDFNNVNALFELRFSIVNAEYTNSGTLQLIPVLVEFVQSFGVSAKFNCAGIEVLSVIPMTNSSESAA